MVLCIVLNCTFALGSPDIGPLSSPATAHTYIRWATNTRKEFYSQYKFIRKRGEPVGANLTDGPEYAVTYRRAAGASIVVPNAGQDDVLNAGLSCL